MMMMMMMMVLSNDSQEGRSRNMMYIICIY